MDSSHRRPARSPLKNRGILDSLLAARSEFMSRLCRVGYSAVDILAFLVESRWVQRRPLPLLLSSEIPTQVVNPSVSRAAVLQGTALTAFVETPSGATVFNPGPTVESGNRPVEYGVGGVPGGA